MTSRSPWRHKMKRKLITFSEAVAVYMVSKREKGRENEREKEFIENDKIVKLRIWDCGNVQ